MSKTVLVTGGYGFVGKNIVEYLLKVLPQSEYRLLVPSRKELDLYSDYSYIDGYIRKHKPEWVIHAAGDVGGILYNRIKSHHMASGNLYMGLVLLSACYNNGVQNFINLGTACSYPKFMPKEAIDLYHGFYEDHLWLGYPEETNAPYGIAKRTITDIVRYMHYDKKNDGGLYITLIPTNMYGPHDHLFCMDRNKRHVIPDLIFKLYCYANILKEEKIVLFGSGLATRDFLYVGDLALVVARLILGMYESEYLHPIINVSAKQEISIKNLAELIKKLLNLNIDIQFQSNELTQLDGQPRRVLCNYRILKLMPNIKWTPLERGLKHTIEIFKSHLDKSTNYLNRYAIEEMSSNIFNL